MTVFQAHICVLIEPPIQVDVDCDMFDISEDGSIQLYRGRVLVGHFPSVEYIYMTGEPEPYDEEALQAAYARLAEMEDDDDDEEDDEEDDDDDEEDDDDDEDDELNDLADVSHVTDPGEDTSALNGSSPGTVVGVVGNEA